VKQNSLKLLQMIQQSCHLHQQPNSPDANPVDYKILSHVQQRVYQSRVHDVEEMNQRLLDIWLDLEYM